MVTMFVKPKPETLRLATDRNAKQESPEPLFRLIIKTIAYRK